MTTNWKEIKFLLVGGAVSFIIGGILRTYWEQISSLVTFLAGLF